jgi:hypothetical protein
MMVVAEQSYASVDQPIGDLHIALDRAAWADRLGKQRGGHLEPILLQDAVHEQRVSSEAVDDDHPGRINLQNHISQGGHPIARARAKERLAAKVEVCQADCVRRQILARDFGVGHDHQTGQAGEPLDGGDQFAHDLFRAADAAPRRHDDRSITPPVGRESQGARRHAVGGPPFRKLVAGRW